MLSNSMVAPVRQLHTCPSNAGEIEHRCISILAMADMFIPRMKVALEATAQVQEHVPTQ